MGRFKHNHNTLKRPLYENCTVRNKFGNIIFRGNKKKCKWYLDRNLATIISEEPFEIQLNFDSKGIGYQEDKYYLQFFENICVCCGTNSKALTRHHIVPYAFRRFFSLEFKEHSYHDILLLCVEHHEEYEKYSEEFRKVLAKEYNAPIHPKIIYVNDIDKAKAYRKCFSYIRALEKEDNIPEDRIIFLKSEINRYLYKYNFDIENFIEGKIPTGPTQGKLIVDQLKDINEFIIRWRKHFIETMKPKFLPEYWNIFRVGK